MSRPEASFISVARITKTQGLNGVFRVELILDERGVFEPGRRVFLLAPQAAGQEREIEFFRRQHGRAVVKLRGIDHISEAEKYVGAELRILSRDLPSLNEGSFYTFQLKGCQVFEVGGDYIGIISDVLDLGGTEILKVDHGNDETLIPFARSYLKRIDLDRRRIEVDLPEGLRELNNAKKG